MNNEEKIWTFLFDKIHNPYGTAALMGNLFAESSLNPINSTGARKLGLSNEQYTIIADERKNNNFITDGVAYGIAQWCYHTRKKDFYEYAKDKNTSVGDLQTQLEYLWIELQKYSTVLKALVNATEIRSASDIVMLKYEKPANKSEAVKIKRAVYGQKYYDKYINSLNIELNKMLATMLSEKLKESL